VDITIILIDGNNIVTVFLFLYFKIL